MHIFTFPLTAFALSLLAHAAALWLFPRLGLLDFPARYGLLRPRIPYPTGIVAVVLFLLFFLPGHPLTLQNTTLLIGVTLLALCTFIDDRHPLPATMRIALHALVSVLIFAGGSRIYSLTNPLPSLTGSAVIPLDEWTVTVPIFGSLPVWSGVFTVLWLGLTINALNWFDGIPGQVSVLSTVGFLTIGLLALSQRVDQPQLAVLAFVLAGLAAGAMIFDLPPATMLMGDTGAMFFGLMFGVLTLYAGGKVATAFLVLGVPLVDFMIVATRRVLRGQSPFLHTKEHLHDLLLARGWSPGQVIALTAGIGATFGITALFLSTLGKFIAAAVLFLLMVTLSHVAARRRNEQTNKRRNE